MSKIVLVTELRHGPPLPVPPFIARSWLCPDFCVDPTYGKQPACQLKLEQLGQEFRIPSFTLLPGFSCAWLTRSLHKIQQTDLRQPKRSFSGPEVQEGSGYGPVRRHATMARVSAASLRTSTAKASLQRGHALHSGFVLRGGSEMRAAFWTRCSFWEASAWCQTRPRGAIDSDSQDAALMIEAAAPQAVQVLVKDR